LNFLVEFAGSCIRRSIRNLKGVNLGVPLPNLFDLRA